MQKQEENIYFDTMPNFREMFSAQVNTESSFDEKEYNTLYEELVEKCHPNKFIDGDNFDENLFEKANKLYAEILKCKDLPEENIIPLRNQAIELLGVCISTKKKYEYLDRFLNPKVYTDVVAEEYDVERVSEAAKWYTILQKNRNDIRLLEDLEIEAQAFIDRRRNELYIIEQKESVEREEAMKRENQRRIQEEKEESTGVGVVGLIVIAVIIAIIIVVTQANK